MLTAAQREEKKRKEKEDRMKKVVEGSNEALMKDFFTQLLAGRERWLVPGKTFCKSCFALNFPRLTLIHFTLLYPCR